jgi:hypothetical protein
MDSGRTIAEPHRTPFSICWVVLVAPRVSPIARHRGGVRSGRVRTADHLPSCTSPVSSSASFDKKKEGRPFPMNVLFSETFVDEKYWSAQRTLLNCGLVNGPFWVATIVSQSGRRQPQEAIALIPGRWTFGGRRSSRVRTADHLPSCTSPVSSSASFDKKKEGRPSPFPMDVLFSAAFVDAKHWSAGRTLQNAPAFFRGPLL